MTKRVLVISSGLRPRSNSAALAEAFAKGAREAGHEVEFVSLLGKTLKFCIGCDKCQTTMRCIFEDDAESIVQKMLTAQVIVFASPVYYYGLSGQLKVLFDRTYPLYAADYAFREIYLLCSAADDSDGTMERPISNVQAWIDCFNDVTLKGVVSALGLESKDKIDGHAALDEAYQLGKSV